MPIPFVLRSCQLLLVRAMLAKDCSSSVCKEPYDNGKYWARWPKISENCTYPVVAFAHGMYTPVLDGYVQLVEHIVQQGFVVVAANTCKSALSGWAGYCPDFGRDVLASITKALQLKYSLSPPAWALKVDESHVGLVGHSMGGAASLKVGGGKYGKLTNLTAVAVLHPACQVEDCGITQSANKQISVPTLYAGTPYDGFVEPGAVWNYHENVKASNEAPSYYALLSCGSAISCDGHVEVNTHLAPTDEGGALWNDHVGRFLNCHMKGKGCSDWPLHPCPPVFPKFGKKLMEYDVRPCVNEVLV